MRLKKVLKLFIIYVLTVLLVGITVKAVKGSLDAKKADEVVLRFAVTSKTFVFDESDTKLTGFINKVYDYADEQPYTNVDAFVVNGDLTGDGSEDAFAAVDDIADKLLRKESALYTTIGEMDFASETIQAEHSDILKNGMDYAVNINGHGFVFLSAEYNSYANKTEWLDETLAKITKDNQKPVFVFQYASLGSTFYGTETWYTYETDILSDVLEKYPTVVDFSSSTVGPGNTVRSIFQKNATYVNNGGMLGVRLNYSEFGYDTSQDMVNARFNKVSQCKIVEVYGDGRVDLLTMDLNTGKLYNNPDNTEILRFTVYPGKTDTYTYNYEKNVSESRPFFDDNASVSLSDSGDGVVLEFDEALDSDGIMFYNIVIYDKAQNVLAESNFYSDFPLCEKESVVKREISGVLESNVGRVVITPYDMFGSSGNPLDMEF